MTPLLLLFLSAVAALPVSNFHKYDTADPTPNRLLDYPVVFQSQRTGIHRTVAPPVKPPKFPKLTVTTWVYLTQYCPIEGFQSCAIICRMSKGTPQTPTLYLTNEGKLVLGVELINGAGPLVHSTFTLPLNTWLSVQLNIHKMQVKIVVRNRSVELLDELMYTYDHMVRLRYDNTDWVIGGNLWYQSIAGAVGMTDVYVDQHIATDQISWPTMAHNTFKLGNGTDEKCEVMRHNLYMLVMKKQEMGEEMVFKDGKERAKFEATSLKIGQQLLNQAYPLLQRGLVAEGYKLLTQAACYGSTNASYTKTVLAGPDTAPDGSVYLQGALEGDALSSLAMAFRHRFITASPIPTDCEMALVYYDRLAVEAHSTINNASLKNVWSETVKLSSDKELYDQEGEGGVLHKKNVELAVEGDIEAQRRLGIQHMWGTHGRAQDLEKAFHYYKLAADQGDPEALHQTALMKIEGKGTKQNKKKGLALLLKAAEEGFVGSLGGLGWYHIEHDLNITKAIHYYQEGAKRGDKDSMYLLGMVYTRNDIPGGAQQKAALTQFEMAASLGHIGASLEAGSLHKFGVGTVRSCQNALRYMSWVAEKHNTLASLTREALDWYLQKAYQKSFLSYQLAAEAGCETSQFNAAYLTERESSATFHPPRSSSVYYYSLSSLQGNKQSLLALRLYKHNLAVLNTELQQDRDDEDDKGKKGEKKEIKASIRFRGHIHEIVFKQSTYNISVEFNSGERMVGAVEIVSVDHDTGTVTKVWSQDVFVAAKSSVKVRRRATLDLPRALLRPKDREYNPVLKLVKLRTWIANIDIWADNEGEVFRYARDRGEIELIGPWTPRKKFLSLTTCLNWGWWVWTLYKAHGPPPVCPVKEEWVNKGYPFIMNGEKCGLLIKDSPVAVEEANTVTMSLWFMLSNRCYSEACSLIYRYDSKGVLYSPSVTVDRGMKLHITVYFGNEGRVASFEDNLPLGRWTHLMISIQDTTLVACVEHGIQRLKTKCYTWTFPQSIVYEENDGMWALGGNFYLPSITGYFGKLHLYRDQYHPENTLPKAITTPAVDDLMWNTKSRKGFKKCVKLD